MPIQPLLDALTLAATMADIKPPLSAQEARVEATRCLYCFDAPCIAACPTGIDVPAFIKKIATDNLTGAARTILEANVLGASCARVCPTQVLCEGACVMLDLAKQPIEIGRLQRFATDAVTERGIDVLQAPREQNGRRVAVLGAGPAGLGCAAELARLGYAVRVFDRQPRGGGLNTYGIAFYKMRPEVSLAEVALIERLVSPSTSTARWAATWPWPISNGNTMRSSWGSAWGACSGWGSRARISPRCSTHCTSSSGSAPARSPRCRWAAGWPSLAAATPRSTRSPRPCG